MFAGCVTGIIVFSSVMRGKTLGIQANVPGLTRRQHYATMATSFRTLVLTDFFYPVHLLCVIYAMNMLLRRVSDHASHSYYNTARDDDDTSRSSVAFLSKEVSLEPVKNDRDARLRAERIRMGIDLQ